MTPGKPRNHATNPETADPGRYGRDSASATTRRGYLWTIYGDNQHNARAGLARGKPALHRLLEMALRSWRAWHPGEQGAICDHDGSLSNQDRELCAALDIDTIRAGFTLKPPTTLNKLVSLVHTPWPLTMHVDLDIVWTGNAGPIWDVPGDWDWAGVDYRYGHTYPDPEATRNIDRWTGPDRWETHFADQVKAHAGHWTQQRDAAGPLAVPCACLLISRIEPETMEAILACRLVGDWSDEVVLARAEQAGKITPGRIPARCVWDTWPRSGWELEHLPGAPPECQWTLTDPAGKSCRPLALHWGGDKGKAEAFEDPRLAHYLDSLPR